jgi:hypothetical protein
MEAAEEKDISQMVGEQGHLPRQQHNQLAQLSAAMGEVLHPRGFDSN